MTRTKKLTYTAVMAVLMAICSWITIPSTIPFTMQTFGVFFAVGLLGGKEGTKAICLYLLLGILGVPVFSGFQGGPQVLFGMTGGYILGFLLAALLMWGMERMFGRNLPVFLVSAVLGLLLCYLFGTLWFLFLNLRAGQEAGIIAVLSMCVFPFVIPDLLKIGLAALLSRRLAPLI